MGRKRIVLRREERYDERTEQYVQTAVLRSKAEADAFAEGLLEVTTGYGEQVVHVNRQVRKVDDGYAVTYRDAR
jgi:hypothetical protein